MGHSSLDEWKEVMKSDFSCDDTTALTYILNDIQHQIDNFPDITTNEVSFNFWVDLKAQVEKLLEG